MMRFQDLKSNLLKQIEKQKAYVYTRADKMTPIQVFELYNGFMKKELQHFESEKSFADKVVDFFDEELKLK